MRDRSGIVAFLGAVSSLVCASPARANECSGIVSPCINDDTLWPPAGPALFVGIADTDTVAARQMGFALVSTYLSRPIVLDIKSPGGSGSSQYVANDEVNGTFLWSYGVTDRLELALALPLTFGQGGTGLAPVTGGLGLKDTAVRDMRFGFAYAILPRPRIAPEATSEYAELTRRGWGVAARLDVSAPTGDSSQFAGEPSAVFVPSVVADYSLDRWFAAAEAGARIRPTTQLLQARIGSQLALALGVGYRILPRELLSVALEGWALPTLTGQAEITTEGGAYVSRVDGTTLVPGEWELSARTAPLRGGDFSIQVGGGGAIPFAGEAATTTPRFRFVLGVRWAPLARDSDGDGVPDSADECPSTPAPGIAGGCPTPPSGGEPEAIHLRLASAKDTCTDEPDLVDGFREDNGCPDEDQDKDGIDDRLDRCPLAPEDFVGLTDGCPEKQSP